MMMNTVIQDDNPRMKSNPGRDQTHVLEGMRCGR